MGQTTGRTIITRPSMFSSCSNMNRTTKVKNLRATQRSETVAIIPRWGLKSLVSHKISTAKLRYNLRETIHLIKENFIQTAL